MKHIYLALGVVIVAASLPISGCDKFQKEEPAAAQQMPPAVVNVMPVRFQTVPLHQTFSGRTSAYQKADVRPQATGIIDEVMYREGSMVEKGQALYRLNVDNYEAAVFGSQAAVNQALANIDTAKASYNNALANKQSQIALLEQAKNDLDRLQPLVEMDAISRQSYDQAITQYKTAQAAVTSSDAAIAQAQANVQSAQAAAETAKAKFKSSQVDLNRTIVRAPITGKTDRSSVTAGALVNANQAAPLVTISKLNPIYVDISQSSSELLRLKQQQASGKIQLSDNTVKLILENGSVYPSQGKLSLAEAKVDEDSGAVTLRAVFNNDNYLLLPGMYVTAQITQGLIPNAVLLPQSAIMRTPKGEVQVYIVDANSKIQIRPVEIEGTYEGKWIVTSGLQMGDKVVIIGGAKVRPEQTVVSQPYTESSTPQAGESRPLNRPDAMPQGQGPIAATPLASQEEPTKTSTDSVE